MTTTEKFVLAIDQGTTSTRAIIFNHAGEIVSVGQKEFTQIFPNPGWVEHNPIEIWETTRTVVAEALQKAEINRHNLAAVGITNQRETTVVWDKNTGEPVYNAIVWQDMRTSDIVKELEGDEGPDRFRQICGLGLSPYFSGSKIKWILDNVEGARERAEAGDLYFGNTDSWVLWNLTGGINGGVHCTDVTNASRTMLMDIRTLQWREDVCEIFGIPMSMLPEIKSSSEIYGYGRKNGLLIDTPIAGILGDQQAATFGQACFEKGMAKNTYGTGCFMLMNTGKTAVSSKNGLITTLACGPRGEACYALEGSIFVGGSAIQWLRDELKIVNDARDTEYFANKAETSNDVYVIPAFTGLGAPYWDPYARGAIVGLTRGTNASHIIRATLESIAYQSKDVIEAMQADSGIPLQALRVDGGASANNFLMQFQSDILGVNVERPATLEVTALGAAFLAGLAVGYWSGLDDVRNRLHIERVFEPSADKEKQVQRYKGWKKAVSRALQWIDVED